MPRHRQRQLLSGDTTTVVADADQADAAFFQIDIHARGTGVEGILDQLLDHRSRPFNYLASGDLVDQDFRQGADRIHAAPPGNCSALPR